MSLQKSFCFLILVANLLTRTWVYFKRIWKLYKLQVSISIIIYSASQMLDQIGY